MHLPQPRGQRDCSARGGVPEVTKSQKHGQTGIQPSGIKEHIGHKGTRTKAHRHTHENTGTVAWTETEAKHRLERSGLASK